jgi:hypothetical protein
MFATNDPTARTMLSEQERFRAHPIYQYALQVSNEMKQERENEQDRKTLVANLLKHPIRLKTVYPR